MRELPILTNCGVNSFSSSALFKFRDRRFSVRIRGISSCRERAMLLSFTSWLDWMPNSTCDTNPASGFDRPSQSSEENFVNCALSLDRILLSCMGDASWWFGFLVKTLLPRISSPPTSQSRQTTDLSMVRHSVFQILGKLLENVLGVSPEFLSPPSQGSTPSVGWRGGFPVDSRCLGREFFEFHRPAHRTGTAE